MAKSAKVAGVSADAMQAAQDSNKAYDNLITVAREAIATIGKNVNENVRINQRVAWSIMEYRRLQMIDGVKPAETSTLLDDKARAAWRKNMADKFIGKAPTMGKNKDQGKIEKGAQYKAMRRIMDDACDFVVAANTHGVTAKDYDDVVSCFAVPVVALLPKDKAWQPMFELAEAHNAKARIPLVNRAYTIAAGTKESTTIRSSLAQVNKAFYSKAPPVKAGNSDAQTNGSTSDAANAGTRAEDKSSSLDPKVVKAVLTSVPLTTMIAPFWAAMNTDPKLPMTLDMFETSERNTLMNIAARINAMIQLDADKNKAATAKAEADKAAALKASADKVKDNVTPISKPAARKRA